jgi:hypothetical protein
MHRRSWLQGSAVAALAALGAPPLAQAATPPQRRLTVEAVQMPAWIDQAGVRTPLAPGDSIAVGQQVETGAAAALVMRLPEGSQVRLGEKSRLSIPSLEVSVQEGRTAVRSRLQLAEGFFRFTSGVVAAATGQRQIDVQLRTATVGIRGTDFWSMTDAAHDAACLFEGRVELATRDQGALVLDKPTAFWTRFFERPVQPVGNATPDELARFLASTEPVAGRGVAVVGGRWRVVAAALARPQAAQVLAQRLRAEGFPALVRARAGQGAPLHEVRINGLASREDAAAVLEKLRGVEGVSGRVALSA